MVRKIWLGVLIFSIVFGMGMASAGVSVAQEDTDGNNSELRQRLQQQIQQKNTQINDLEEEIKQNQEVINNLEENNSKLEERLGELEQRAQNLSQNNQNEQPGFTPILTITAFIVSLFFVIKRRK